MGRNIGRDRRFGWASERVKSAGRRRLRPAVQILEERRLLTGSYVVTSPSDTLDGSGNPTNGTLRWAVEQANEATSASTIEFDTTIFGTTPQTINLAQGQLELTNNKYAITIVGPADGVTISGGDNSRVFQVDDGVTASLSGVTITDGNADQNGGQYEAGGGLYNDDGSVTLTGCTISGNSAQNGGGVATYNGGMTTMVQCTVSGNTAGDSGGGVRNAGGTMSLSYCDVEDNTTSGNGGGIDNNGTMTIDHSTISGNDSGFGGGVRNVVNPTDRSKPKLLTIRDSTISDNSAQAFGGGLSLYFGTAALTGCTISSNSAADGGGGFIDGGTATFTDCTLTGNSAVDGGGLGNAGTVTLTGCTVSANTAKYLGGGVMSLKGLSQANPTTDLTDCTISGNSAADNGGGFYIDVALAVTIENVTISANTSPSVGGLVSHGPTTITDTIVAGNIGTDIGGTLSGSSNLIGTGAPAGLDAADNLLGVTDPLLSPLGDYGGPTQTIALLPGSPAIGAGTTIAGVTADQRGFPLDSPVADIGAFQSQPELVVNMTMDTSYGILSPKGELSLRQADGLANFLGGTETITFDPTVFATPQTITLAAGELEFKDSSGTIAIDGPGVGVTISGGGNSRVFQADDGVTASLSGLTITGGNADLNGGQYEAGGGLYNDGGSVTLTGCTISGNSAQNGGGVATYNGGMTTMVQCTVSGNTAGDSGGGVRNAGGTTSLSYCDVEDNTSSGNGGGIDNYGIMTIDHSTISGNDSSTGGGIRSVDTPLDANHLTLMTVMDSTISDNSAQAFGGGLSLYFGTATLTGCTISGNSADDGGGGFIDGGTATFTDCTLTGNSAVNGGGLGNAGTVTLTGCTVSANTAVDFGGGMMSQKGLSQANPTTDLTDCTISGNSAAHNGGGLYISAAHAVTIENVTVSGNTSPSVGGLVSHGPTTLTDTIVAGNIGTDVGGTVSGSSNLIGTGAPAGLDAADNLLGVTDPLLSALGNYGGPTQTIALLPGSPAIGAGTAIAGVTADQRGVARPTSTPDIGAFQDRGFTISVVSGDAQSTLIDTPFPAALVVSVVSNFNDPVAGGTVTFVPPSDGPSAFLSGSTTPSPQTVSIANTNGLVQITAAANGVAGGYQVTAATNGVASPAVFSLTNVAPTFSNLASPTVIYGTHVITFSGTILAGSTVPSGVVTLDFGGVVPTLTVLIAADGEFSATVNFPTLDVASDDTVTYSYASGPGATPVVGTGEITVTPAPLTVVVDDQMMVYGSAVPTLTGTLTGVVNGDEITASYGTAATASSDAGSYSITAMLSDPDGRLSNYTVTSTPGTLIVTRASQTITWPAAPLSIVYGTPLGAGPARRGCQRPRSGTGRCAGLLGGRGHRARCWRRPGALGQRCRHQRLQPGLGQRDHRCAAAGDHDGAGGLGAGGDARAVGHLHGDGARHSDGASGADGHGAIPGQWPE